MKAVVVHRGARDGYQVALALAERGLLEYLVTDLYWTGGGPLTRKLLGAGLLRRLDSRLCAGLPPDLLKRCLFSGLLSFAWEKSPRAPFEWRARMARWADRVAGTRAGYLASQTGAAILSYSYYGYAAFQQADSGSPRILFQLHPHPVSVRRILLAELAEFPECSESLQKEWELALPEKDFARLSEEPMMADRLIVACTFSRDTLIENGVPASRIFVAPYGVDLERFRPQILARRPFSSGSLRLLFVGQISQRKGIRYLLQAVALLPNLDIELTICGRVVDSLSLFRGLDERVKVRGSVSPQELLEAYRSADLFVFPSLAEGFAHVLLEAMACGLPILSTTRTAAPDLISENIEGFVVKPNSAEALAERIEWAAGHRAELAEMGRRARQKAEQFTWQRFRGCVAGFVSSALGDEESAISAEVQHV